MSTYVPPQGEWGSEVQTLLGIDPRPFPPEPEPIPDCDLMRRDELTGDDARTVAALDEWLHREHGILAGHHGLGLFLQLLAEQGLTITPIEWRGDES